LDAQCSQKYTESVKIGSINGKVLYVEVTLKRKIQKPCSEFWNCKRFSEL